MFKKFKVLSAVMVLSLGLMACGTNDDPEIPVDGPPVMETPSEGDTTQTPSVDNPVDTPTDVETPGNTTNNEIETIMSAVEIFDKYTTEYPDLMFEELSLDKELNGYVYKIDAYDATSEHEFKINANDGSLIKKDTDNDSDSSGEITKEHVDKINSFVDQALADAGNDATLDEWTLSHDDGMVKIEIEVKLSMLNDMEYTYDVNTGTLIEKED